jgi:hypothetical protein
LIRARHGYSTMTLSRLNYYARFAGEAPIRPATYRS